MRLQKFFRFFNGTFAVLVVLVALHDPVIAFDQTTCSLTTPTGYDIDLSDKHVLTVGTSENEAILTGIMSSVLREAYKRSGLIMDLQKYPERRSIYMVNEGRLDAELMRAPVVEEEFKNLKRVNFPVFQANEGGFYRDPKFAVRHYHELKNARIAYKKSVINWEKRVADFSHVIKVADDIQGMQLLDAGRIDVFLDNALLGNLAIKKIGAKNIYFSGPFITVNFYHYVNSAQQDWIVPALEVTLRQMKSEGIIDDIVETCKNLSLYEDF